MTRFCPNCGTEVDDTAVFCPTCGQAIDQGVETQIPPAPAWPDPPQPESQPERQVQGDAEPYESTQPARWTDDDVVPARVEDPTRLEEAPPAAPPPALAAAPPAERQAPPERRQSPQVN